MMKSWKTTVMGVFAILSAAGVAFSQYASNGFPGIQWEVLVTALASGVGLILAKDFNMTNSQVPGETQKAVPPPPPAPAP